ncbi:MAG: MFS transporter [Spirochaetia bacterium]|nr:MFS transporter [Spirochaetia bacterium]
MIPSESLPGHPTAGQSSPVQPLPDPVRFGPAVPWVGFLTLMVFFGMLPRLLVSPVLLRLADDLGIGFDQAASFFLTMSVGYVSGLLLSGYVARAVGHRWTIVLSIAGGGIAFVVLAGLHGPALFHLVLLLGGFANGLYPGSGIASVVDLVPETHRGKALGLHEIGPNLAFMAAPIAAALLVPGFGWRGLFMAAGILVLLMAAAFAVFGRASGEAGAPPNFGNLTELARKPAFWTVSALFVVGATAAFGVYSVLPTYLMADKGMDERLVNSLIGFSRVSGTFAILAAGGLADRFGAKLVLAVVLGITGMATALLGLASGNVLLVAVFFQPAIIGAAFPVLLNALSEVTRPGIRSLAVALAIPMANLGGAGLAPLALSALGAAGLFRVAFVVLGLMVVSSLTLVPFLGRPGSIPPLPSSPRRAVRGPAQP